ncbi:MAG: TolC family protein [Verrucomicrobia bacterium]|nr:TolC family protein [Verrucomicrobiota bacterium]
MRTKCIQWGAALAMTGVLAVNAGAGDNGEVRPGSRAPRRFTLDEAVITALQQNPSILTARQEIERTKGLYIEMRAAILPQVNASATFSDVDPHLESIGGFSGAGTTGTTGTTGSTGSTGSTASTGATGGSGSSFSGSVGSERSYSLSIAATQVVFAGGRVVSQIRSADFQRDSSYYSFRNAIDTIVSTVKQQFYQVLLNKALIGVQEESVQLLQSQLQDQQNRFEAGTVPRFNVLQAQVALSNQIPQLISARNNYRISQLQLAKTLGLEFDPARGDNAPLEAVGELTYVPRPMSITRAIAVAKENRPFLKQQKAVVLSNREQVGVARSTYFPQINVSAGPDFRSSAISDNIGDVRSGYVLGATGTWAIWDWGATYGRVKQAKAVLEESKITLDDDTRQVELEVQQAYSNIVQGRELIQSQEKNVEQAAEALRLAQARLDAGAGTQLEVLDARVQLTTARSTQLQALFTYNAAVAEFDRVTATEVKYSLCLDEPSTRRKLRTDAAPTPGPRPTPLPLNGDCAVKNRTQTTVVRSSGK